jgi:hypothetical protein
LPHKSGCSINYFFSTQQSLSWHSEKNSNKKNPISNAWSVYLYLGLQNLYSINFFTQFKLMRLFMEWRWHTFRLIGTDGFAVGLKNDSNLVFQKRKKKLGMTSKRKGLALMSNWVNHLPALWWLVLCCFNFFYCLALKKK